MTCTVPLIRPVRFSVPVAPEASLGDEVVLPAGDGDALVVDPGLLAAGWLLPQAARRPGTTRAATNAVAT